VPGIPINLDELARRLARRDGGAEANLQADVQTLWTSLSVGKWRPSRRPKRALNSLQMAIRIELARREARKLPNQYEPEFSKVCAARALHHFHS
jgi:hypothetical protein